MTTKINMFVEKWRIAFGIPTLSFPGEDLKTWALINRAPLVNSTKSIEIPFQLRQKRVTFNL
jgi:hypothetical protein